MKKIIAVLLVLGSLSVDASPQIPDYTPTSGYWVAVENVKVKKDALLQYYNDDNHLIAEEHISGRKLHLRKAATLKKLQLLLEKALAAYDHRNDTATKVLVDNDKIRITEYISRPGEDVCGKGKHSHPDHATILLTDAKVRTTKADGTTEIETYSAGQQLYVVDRNGKTEKMSTDGVFWVKGTTHSVTNIGNKPIRFYIIETL